MLEGQQWVQAQADQNMGSWHCVSAKNASTSFTHVALLPWTHYIKFLVDEQWRIADDLPTAVDDGSLANYVAVPIGPTPPQTSPALPPPPGPPPRQPPPVPPPQPQPPTAAARASCSSRGTAFGLEGAAVSTRRA